MTLDGYVWEWCPTHPQATHGSWLQHRLVIELHLGRFLHRGERVHHRDGVRHHNALSNLELFSSHSDHMLQHWKTKGRRAPEFLVRLRTFAADPTASVHALGVSHTTVLAACKEQGIEWVRRIAYPGASELTEQSVREALQGHTTREAALLLNCHAHTLYLRFGHLLKKRPSPNCLDVHKEEIRVARRAGKTLKQIATRYGVSTVTVNKSIQRWRAQDESKDEFAVPRNRPTARERLRSRNGRYLAALYVEHDVDPPEW
jgi:hypothetical protein